MGLLWNHSLIGPCLSSCIQKKNQKKTIWGNDWCDHEWVFPVFFGLRMGTNCVPKTPCLNFYFRNMMTDTAHRFHDSKHNITSAEL